MKPVKEDLPTDSKSETTVASAPNTKTSSQPPALPPGLKQYYIPARGSAPTGKKLFYQPKLFGATKIQFSNTRAKVDTSRSLAFITPITEEAIPVLWENAEPIDVPATDLEKTPRSGAQFASLPSTGGDVKKYSDWEKDFATWLYGTQRLELLKSSSLKLTSQPGEDERDFRIRLQQNAREQRDEAIDKLRSKYSSKLATLQERKRKAEQTVEVQAEQAKRAKLDTALSIGSTLLGAFAGRKVSTKAKSALRGFSKSADESKDVKRALETVEAIDAQITELNAQFEADTAELESKIDPLTEELETISIKPTKTNIQVQLSSLAWAPYWKDEQGTLTPAW
jgi:hypothetical protein